eukprot:174813-Rhodomonas_salina.2
MQFERGKVCLHPSASMLEVQGSSAENSGSTLSQVPCLLQNRARFRRCADNPALAQRKMARSRRTAR